MKVATVPDPGAGRFTYNSTFHPEAGTDGGLLSCNMNTQDPNEIRRDASTYRPDFIRVNLP